MEGGKACSRRISGELSTGLGRQPEDGGGCTRLRYAVRSVEVKCDEIDSCDVLRISN